jgi:hypothetical protein
MVEGEMSDARLRRRPNGGCERRSRQDWEAEKRLGAP